MPQRKHRIRSILASAVLSLSALAGCSSRLEPQKSIFPNFSLKTSVLETINRVGMKAENAADYYDIYVKNLENSLEERKQHQFSYPEERMIINSLFDYDYLSREREEFNPRRYEEAEDFVRDISGEAFREAFRQFDVVVAFENDFKDWFYKDKEESKLGIQSNVKDYISKVTKASKIDWGASPSISHRRIHFRTYARLENVLGFSNIKTEIGTNTLEIRLTRKLNENWIASAKYEIEEYERKESEVVLGISRNYGKNIRLTINGGWGKPLKAEKSLNEGNERTQETYAGANLAMLF